MGGGETSGNGHVLKNKRREETEVSAKGEACDFSIPSFSADLYLLAHAFSTGQLSQKVGAKIAEQSKMNTKMPDKGYVCSRYT